jgi:hypothetical protein
MRYNTKLIFFLIVLIAVYLCFMVFLNPKIEINEHFVIPYLDNQLKDAMLQSVQDLRKINVYKEVDVPDITQKMRTSLNIDPTQLNLYNQNKNRLDNNLVSLENQLKNLKTGDLFKKNQSITKYRSIRANGNAQPLNIAPLSNDKYLISLNGKCLESDGLLRTTIQPCNAQNPNQYFTVNTVVNQTDYNGYVDSQTNWNYAHASDIDVSMPPFKYPFHVVKSDSGNCLINNDGGVSVVPCKQFENQQWVASDEPAECYT